jgi:peroxiredoxin
MRRFDCGRIALVVVLATPAAALAIEAGARAPSFSAERLGGAGAVVTLAQHRGQVLYVDFWASWCVPCRASMPALDALFRRHRERGFAVIGVNKDVSAADAERFLRRVPVSFALVSDTADALARQFEVKAMPSGYLVDRKGIVRHVHRGFSDETAAALAREIEVLLEEKP